jgi:molecular chaperone GrpE
MNTENQTENLQEEVTTEENGQKENPISADSAQESSSELDKVSAELAEMKDKYIRLYSEFDNFRRRTSKEKIELITTAEEKLMLALLPVADDIDRARNSFTGETDLEEMKKGVELVFSKLYKILESKGLKPLNSKGEIFNPDLHEAITQIPAPSEDLKGKIVDEIEKGYYLNEKLIRVSKVVIGN